MVDGGGLVECSFVCFVFVLFCFVLFVLFCFVLFCFVLFCLSVCCFVRVVCLLCLFVEGWLMGKGRMRGEGGICEVK